MADTNRVQLKYIEENPTGGPSGTWGVIRATADMTEIRMTGESLAFNIANIVSNEIRSDRQTTDLIQTGAECSGGFNSELSFNAYDDFLEGALWSDWGTAVSFTDSGTSASVGGSGFSTTNAGAYTTVSVGQWIKVSGFTTTALDTYYRITAVASTFITTETAPSTVEAAGDVITFAGTMIRNGVVEHSYSIQRANEDMSPVTYFNFAGMVVNSMTCGVESESISTINFDFIGKSATAGTGAMTSGSTTSASANDVMNSVGDVVNILWDGVEDTSLLVSGVNFTVGNNMRSKKCIGTLGAADVGAGKIDVTGSFSVYFNSLTLYEKYLASSTVSFSFRMTDGTNAYIFTFPRVKIESDTVNAGGGDADVMEEISWRAIRHATYDCTLQIDKFSA